MRDVGDCGNSRAACATEWAIQRKGRVAIFARLLGGNATVRDFGRITSDILQSGGYRRASREYPRDMTTDSDMGII